MFDRVLDTLLHDMKTEIYTFFFSKKESNMFLISKEAKVYSYFEKIHFYCY